MVIMYGLRASSRQVEERFGMIACRQKIVIFPCLLSGRFFAQFFPYDPAQRLFHIGLLKRRFKRFIDQGHVFM